jgi:hypothetical protein
MGDVHRLPSAPPEQVPPAGADPVALAEVAAKAIAGAEAARQSFDAEAKTTAQHRLEESRERVILHKRIETMSGELRTLRWVGVAMTAAFLADAAARVFG